MSAESIPTPYPHSRALFILPSRPCSASDSLGAGSDSLRSLYCTQGFPQKVPPFVIIGVNSDEDKKPLKAVMEKEKIAWRSFWCGEKGPMSDLPSAWNVTGWPTMYVLDHKGIIRGKQVYGQSLDRVVDKWIAVAERGE